MLTFETKSSYSLPTVNHLSVDGVVIVDIFRAVSDMFYLTLLDIKECQWKADTLPGQNRIF